VHSRVFPFTAGHVEYAECTDGRQTEAPRFLHALTFVDQEQIRVQMDGQHDHDAARVHAGHMVNAVF
jgi:hypothetical protein